MSRAEVTARPEGAREAPRRPLSFDDIPLVLTVEELMPILSIGRNTAFSLVRSGRIRSIRTGKQIRILKHELRQFLEGSPGTEAPRPEDEPPLALAGNPFLAAKGGGNHAARQ